MDESRRSGAGARVCRRGHERRFQAWRVALRYFEERSMKWVVENVSRAGGFLFGRRTYEVFAAHWPNASPEEQALAQPLNTLPKYVASRTLREPLAWQNSRLLEAWLPSPWPL